MRFDITSLGDHLPDPHTQRYNSTQAERYASIVETAVRGEALGYSAAWIGEHHASDYIVASPQMLLAAIAGQTKTIRLGSAVSLLPNSDPIRLAEDFATLDLLSRGRAEIGFGSGITEHTFRLFGQKVEDAVELSKENLDLVQLLWNELDVEWSGKFRPPIRDTRLEPRTLSGKALPITRATGASIETAIDAGRRGHKLALLTVISGFSKAKPIAEAYRKAYRQAGHDPRGMNVSGAAFAFVRKDGEKAREQFGPYIGNYQAFAQMLLGTKGMTRSLGLLLQTVMEAGPQVMGEAMLVGEPSELVEMIHRNHERMGGFDELMLLFDVGGLPHKEVLQSLEIFAEQVIPRVRIG